MPSDGTYVPLNYGAPELPTSPEAGNYQPFYGSEGFPQFGGGAAGMLANIGMSIGAQGLMGPMNMMPMGISDRNMYDRMQQQRMTRAHDEMLRSVTQQDRRSMMATAKGMAALAGTQWTTEVQKGAESAVSGAEAALPLLAQMAPDALDAAMGQRGSAVGMAHQMFMGGRMRMDPVTGGMASDSPERWGKKSGAVFDELYGGDRYKKRDGVGASRMGQMYFELQSRGMMAGPATMQEMAADDNMSNVLLQGMRNKNIALPDELKGAGGISGTPEERATQRAALQRHMRGMTPEQTSALSSDTGVSSELDKFDSKKVAESLKKYQGAVSAMQEIFGASGRPNAPMAELINSLNALSGGSMSQLEPDKVEEIARTSSRLASYAGVGIQGAMMATAESSQMAQAMGLNPAFASSAAQAGLAFTGAYQQMGMGSFQAWGRRDMNEMRQFEEKQTLRAANSTTGLQVGTALRLQDELGLNEDTMFKQGAAGQKAKAYMQAIKSGQSTFGPGNQSVRMSQADYMAMMAGGVEGVSEEQLGRMLSQEERAKEALHKHGGEQVVRAAQGAEMRDYASQVTAYTMEGALKAGGVTDQTRRGQMAQGASTAAMNSLFAMTAGQRTSLDRRTSIMAGAIETQMRGSEEGRNMLDGMNDQQRKTWLRSRASDIYGEAEQNAFIVQNGGMQTILDLNDPGMHKRMDMLRSKAGLDSQIAKSMAGLGKGGIAQRVIQAIQDVGTGSDADLRKILAKGLGGVEGTALGDAVVDAKTKDGKSLYKQVQEDQAAIRLASDAAASETNPERKQAALAKLESMKQALDVHVGEMKNTLESNNVRLDSPIRREDVKRAEGTQAWVLRETQRLGPSGKVDLSWMEDKQRAAAESAANTGTGGVWSLGALLSANDKQFADATSGMATKDAKGLKTLQGARSQYNETLRNGARAADQSMADLANAALSDDRTMLAGGPEARQQLKELDTARMERAKAVQAAGGEAEYMRKVAAAGASSEMGKKEAGWQGTMTKTREFLGNLETGKGKEYSWMKNKDAILKLAAAHNANMGDLLTMDESTVVSGWKLGNEEDASMMHQFFASRDKESAENAAMQSAWSAGGKANLEKVMGLSGEDLDTKSKGNEKLSKISNLLQGKGASSVDAQVKMAAFSRGFEALQSIQGDHAGMSATEIMAGHLGTADQQEALKGLGGLGIDKSVLNSMSTDEGKINAMNQMLKQELSGSEDKGGDNGAKEAVFKITTLNLHDDGHGGAEGKGDVEHPAADKVGAS